MEHSLGLPFVTTASYCRNWQSLIGSFFITLKRKIGNNTVINCSVIGPRLRLNAKLFHLLSRLMFNRGWPRGWPFLTAAHNSRSNLVPKPKLRSLINPTCEKGSRFLDFGFHMSRDNKIELAYEETFEDGNFESETYNRSGWYEFRKVHSHMIEKVLYFEYFQHGTWF